MNLRLNRADGFTRARLRIRNTIQIVLLTVKFTPPNNFFRGCRRIMPYYYRVGNTPYSKHNFSIGYVFYARITMYNIPNLRRQVLLFFFFYRLTGRETRRDSRGFQQKNHNNFLLSIKTKKSNKKNTRAFI